MNPIEYQPIGVIHTPYKIPEGTPIQPPVSGGAAARVEVFGEYAAGLTDLEGFSNIYLIYHFHLARKFSLKVRPYLDGESHGLFATRAPARPNAIGLSVVELIGMEKNILHVKNIDVIDGTPLLDIKPYVPAFDIRQAHKIGWLEKKIKNLEKTEDDGRFSEED